MADVVGSQEKYETTGRKTRQDSARTVTLTYHGAYTTLLAAIQDKGAVFSGTELSGTWYVVLSDLVQEEDGEMGTLSVTVTDSSTSAPTAAVTPVFVQYDIDFVEVNQPIEMHPSFLNLVQDGQTDETLKAWMKFKASPLAVRLEKQYLEDPDDDESQAIALPQTIKSWAELYNRGIETYMTYLPVVSKVSEYDAKPYHVGSDIGTKDDPPSEAGVETPGDYGEWLKTCDKTTYSSTTGKWQRTEQWTCAAEWPDLLYANTAT